MLFLLVRVCVCVCVFALVARMGLSDFKVIKFLGKGSYGSVHKVIRKTDGKEYAIKEINIRNMNQRERFVSVCVFVCACACSCVCVYVHVCARESAYVLHTCGSLSLMKTLKHETKLEGLPKRLTRGWDVQRGGCQ